MDGWFGACFDHGTPFLFCFRLILFFFSLFRLESKGDHGRAENQDQGRGVAEVEMAKESEPGLPVWLRISMKQDLGQGEER